MQVEEHVPFHQVYLHSPEGDTVFTHSSRLKQYHSRVVSSSFPMSYDEIWTWRIGLDIRTVFNLNVSRWDEDEVYTIHHAKNKKGVIRNACSGEERLRAKEELGITVHHMPIADMTAPLVWLKTVVDAAEKAIDAGPGAVLFHCNAGRGRSVAAAIALCIKRFGKTSAEYPRYVYRLNQEQRDSLHEFERELVD